MGRHHVTLSGTLAADTFRALVDLFGFPSVTPVRIVGGTLTVAGNPAVIRIVAAGSPAPATADPGTDVAADAGIGIQESDDWYLSELWVRNGTAGSNATVTFSGTLEA